MKTPARLVLFAFVLATTLLAACSPAATRAPEPTAGYFDEAPVIAMAPTDEPAATDGLAFKADSGSAQDKGGAAAPNAESPQSGVDGDVSTNNTLPDVPQQQTGRMIIKNADVKIQVKDTDIAIDGTTQIISDLGGYIISSRVWYQDYSGTNYKYATISMGVPVDQFEAAMRRLRGLAVRVLDENASGQDVSTEFVDLQSQLGNLEATRDRIRSFLEDAKTVEESLRINQELSNIEDQIEKVKGRMTYLSGRSAYSTITLNIEPNLPILTPTPTYTPTATPTPRPSATPTVWNPGKTFDGATHTVTSAYQAIVEVLIFLLVVVVPLVAPPIIVIWALWKLATRKKKPASGG